MSRLDVVGDGILSGLARKNQAREEALSVSRLVIQHSARSIRAAHRDEMEGAERLLEQAGRRIVELRKRLADHPDLYFAGYVQDALKEYAEARLVAALVRGHDLPGPDELGVEHAAYLNGLGEAVGELRRHILDLMRRGEVERCEPLLETMDEIYGFLVTVDFPDAITGGLRRTTDVTRSLLERTRGDLTLTLQQMRLERALGDFEERIESA